MTITNWAYLDRQTMFIALDGCMTGEEHKETVRIMAEIARDRPVRNLIVDKSRVGNGERDEDIPGVADTAASVLSEAGIRRVAVLVAHDDPTAEPFAKAFRRRHGRARTFRDWERARKWIGVRAQDKSDELAVG